MVPPAETRDEALTRAVKGADGAPTRVLIVEDDEDSREMLIAFLGSEGYDVVGAATAEDGLDALVSKRFGLVISDHRLPGKTGAWMLSEALSRELLRGVGALLWSADPDPHCQEGVKVLKKPVDLDCLLIEVEDALERARRPTPESRRSAAAAAPRAEV